MTGVERIDGAIGRLALLGAAATRKVEGEALAAFPPFTLMARAGEAVARLALAVAPHAQRIAVFAGPGNNGGDGIEAATRLCGWGKQATVIRVPGGAAVPPDAARALARADDAGVEMRAFDVDEPISDDRPDLVIDALLGIGASRPPEGAIAAAIGRIADFAALGAHVLAIDVPSGLDVDRGQPLGGACVRADDTLTLIAPKPGLFTGSGRDHAGRIWCARLGVDAVDASAWLVGTRDSSCASPPRRQASHKGSFGDVAVVGGAPGMAGAAWLSARAAHAAGAGRVFVDQLGAGEGAGTQEASLHIDPVRPELMFRRAWWSGSEAAVIAATTVVCGCGGGDAVRATLPKLLSTAARLVLDADALNAIAADPSLRDLAAARERRGHATIMTPHPLEAARLLASTAAAVQADRIGAARELSARFGSVVILKGSGTVITAADGTARINVTGNASLASAGTGDVLAGWIGGRWASLAGNAFDIATRAAIEHGAAAEPQGRGALRAGDLVERLYSREHDA